MFVRRRQQRFGRGTEDEVIAEINDKQAFFLRLVRKISQDKGIAPEHGAIDATAAGWGWYTGGIQDASAFTVPGSEGMQAATGSSAAGKMDLFTVLEHELGHELGLTDVNPELYPSDLMASTLPTGVRRQPTTQDLDALFASMGGQRL